MKNRPVPVRLAFPLRVVADNLVWLPKPETAA
jgi:hypothetical protein